MELRPVFRINKSTIRNILGKTMDYNQTYSYSVKRDSSKCEKSGCPYFAMQRQLLLQLQDEKDKEVPNVLVLKSIYDQLKQIKESCLTSGCHNCSKEKIYNNDKKTYHLYEQQYINKRLPKSCIRLYLALFAIPQQMLGNIHFINNVGLKSLSELLGMTPATTKKALELLEAFRYIVLSRSSGDDYFNIVINDYDSMHLKAVDGGAGYVTLTNEELNIILSIKNVNALRLEVLKILKITDVRTDDVSESFNINELKNVLPSHMNYQNKYIALLNENSLFLSSVEQYKVIFNVKTRFSFKFDYDSFKESIRPELEDFLFMNNIKLSGDMIDNVLDLSTEYSYQNLTHSLLKIKQIHIDAYENVKNLGSLLRYYCQQNSTAA